MRSLVFTKIIKAIVTMLREMGIRLIISIDDILVMAESETLLKDHIAGIIYFMENLGFIMYFPKSLLEPTKMILSRISSGLHHHGVETPRRQDEDPPGRGKEDSGSRSHIGLRIIQFNVKKCYDEGDSNGPPLLSAATSGASALNRSCQNYRTRLCLLEWAKEELHWFTTHLTNWNGQSLIAKKLNTSLETDALQTDWGAVCEGVKMAGP